MQAHRSVLGRGAIAGVIGAVALALWFLVIDVVRDTPLHTPAFVASALGGMPAAEMNLGLIAMYTALHVALFVLVGIACVWVLDRTGAPPHFLLGLVLGFLLFDIIFFAGVIMTGVNVVRALGWPEVLAGNLLAGLALFGYLQLTAPAGTPGWSALLFQSRIARDGVLTGLIGAVAVAVWYLVLDLVQARPLFTPAALGSALFLGANDVAEVQRTLPILAGYTLVHVVMFMIVGFIAAALVIRSEKYPPLLLGGVLLFVVLQTFAIGLIAILATWLLDVLRWWTIAVANLIAAVAMGAFLWRRHPHIGEALARQDLQEPRSTQERARRLGS